MRTASAAVALAALGAAIASCAYYNGLYNANRLVKEAERAEREGLESEARSLWSQAAVKAESVAARYPESKYRDDALLVWGRSLQSIGECERGITPLALALESSPDSTIRRQSRLLLGRCYYETGEYQGADSVLTRLAVSLDSAVAVPALLWRGQARLAAGLYDAAVSDLVGCGLPQAQFPLALAYTYDRQPLAAQHVLLSAQVGSAQEHQWLSVLNAVGGRYPDVAGTVVDHLVERADLSIDGTAMLLLQDGERRLEGGRPDHAVVRFRQLMDLAPGSRVAAIAQVELVQAELRLADGVDQLPAMLERVRAVELEEEDSKRLRLLQLSTDLELAVAGLTAPWPTGGQTHFAGGGPDLDLFMAAEAMRYEWSAVTLAVALLREVPLRFPRSPIAPKALLAAAWLDPTRADSLLAVLHRDYPSSPYTLVLRGAAGDEYTALEDSLRTLLKARQRPTSNR
ncbi:MAG: tetratricopeptide repeat protein [Gemmatimonadota bacterium]|nr:MAG: tetratricopeptide repeat protein [Gemmatimonadota bacterium]